MSPTGNLRYLSEDQPMLERLVETAGKEMYRDATALPRRHVRRPERGPYSPNVGEGTFSEVARRGVYSVCSESKEEESAACRVFSMG
jgi:hypothetical protein